MRTYQLESEINEQGIIVLPYEMKRLHKHRIKLTIVDLEPDNSVSADCLDSVTKKFSTIEENDLNLNEIYKKR
ncbi:MAG: hypothetical protein HQK65_12140 [Desulfamplus sp.]|nr:hypothetical protein [Desulfamplus sp.]